MLTWPYIEYYSDPTICFCFQIFSLSTGQKDMLRAMTKPALMTFSHFEAIKFYFNAKLTDFAMFSYQFNISVTYCPVYTDYETHVYLLLHIL